MTPTPRRTLPLVAHRSVHLVARRHVDFCMTRSAICMPA